jgi:peptide/nickel transport system substrate-binding protein
MIRRRTFLTGATALAMPAIARAEGARVLKFIPQSDLLTADPLLNTAYMTRNHGYMVFDTLFGIDGSYRPQPQMVEGTVVEDDGKLWKLTLRPGMLFHDGEKVLARDCVASIRRWGARDALGNALMSVTDELSAPDDRTIQFRLKKPFPLLPVALGKTSTPMLPIMPERLAKTDPFKPVSEIVGSGPFRYVANERVAGSLVVYERFAGYRPREGGVADWTAGPKVVNFDRVEWQIIPDEGTAASALQTGEVDWWELPTADLTPVLLRNGRIKVEIKDPTGVIGFMRMNFLHPPFDNPEIRRALLGVVNQQDFMIAIAGTDPKLWRTDIGLFCPGTPMATDVDMQAINGPRDPAKARAAIKAAGYKGEKTVLLAATDTPYRKAMADVGMEMLQQGGLDVDYQAVDWATLIARRENKGTVDKGGWSAIFTTLSGLDLSTPGGHAFRGTGEKAWFGWPTSPKLEELRNAWLEARDEAAQKTICAEMQHQWFIDVPHIPIGQWFQPAAYRDNLEGMVNGFPVFWNIRRKA